MTQDQDLVVDNNEVWLHDDNIIKGDIIGGNKYEIKFYALATFHEPPIEPRGEPYKFLSYYNTTDADIFYGRETLSDSLVSKIDNHKLILINGQSWSGKTSLINAGIIPLLIKKGYLAMVFRDYGYPSEIIKTGLEKLENLNLDLFGQQCSI